MRADREAGFTLIELLVSMTLLGLLFVLLFGGLRFGMRAWERGTINADASDSVRTVQELLRGELERACPRRSFSYHGVATLPRVAFSGSPDALSFVGPVPGSAICAPLQLAAPPDGKLRRLILKTRVNDPGTDLLRGVQSVAFAYRSRDGWEQGWDGRADLPDVVRIRVTFPPDDGRVWPELFITPRISAEADCTYDPATKSCRGS
jgi:general secretion pathway protein J